MRHALTPTLSYNDTDVPLKTPKRINTRLSRPPLCYSWTTRSKLPLTVPLDFFLSLASGLAGCIKDKSERMTREILKILPLRRPKGLHTRRTNSGCVSHNAYCLCGHRASGARFDLARRRPCGFLQKHAPCHWMYWDTTEAQASRPGPGCFSAPASSLLPPCPA